MIQRSLYKAIEAGFNAIQDDPEILDDVFGPRGYGLDATEIKAIKVFFKAKPPSVAQGYSRTNHTMPLVTIILGDESEAEHVIGDDAGMIDDPEDPDFGADCVTAIWQHKYPLLVYSEHPDVTTYVYEVVKSIMLTSESIFADAGIFFTDLSGMDLMPDSKYIPDDLFVRQLTLSCKREFLRVIRDSKLGKAFKVGGIFVDKSGSSGDVGGVKTLLTTYTPGEEDEG